MKLKELLKNIEDVKIDYDYELEYNTLYNYVTNYMNESQDFRLEYIFDDFIDYDTAEDIAKSELEKGGLVRIYYFLGDANPNNDIFRIDGYGNLTNVNKEDIEMVKDQLIEDIKQMIGE
jgi:hypothetical protein